MPASNLTNDAGFRQATPVGQTGYTIMENQSAFATYTIEPDTPAVTAGTTGNVITLAGSGTLWTIASPTFLLSADNGASIEAQVAVSDGVKTVTLTAGTSAGTLTITDPTTGATTSITVNAAAVTRRRRNAPVVFISRKAFARQLRGNRFD